MVSPVTSAASSESPVRLGIVGLTHTHVHWIFESQRRGDFEIVGIAEPNRELAKRFSAQYGFRMDKVFSTMEQMVDETRPEGVTAFGTIRQHLDVVQLAAPRRIHVMVEKPLAVSLEHAMEMKRLADEHDVELLTNYETTWYPANHKSYEIIASGDIGPIRKVVVHDGHKGPKKLGINQEFLDWLLDPVQNGGGAITDFGCYGANLMTWLMRGEKPRTVTAVTQQLQPENNPHVDDEATIILTYPSAQAIIQASWNWPVARKDMEIYGLTGTVHADDRYNVRLQKSEDSKVEYLVLDDRKTPFDDPFSMFGAVIRGQVKLPAHDPSSLENNMIVMEILDAALTSSRMGKTVRLD